MKLAQCLSIPPTTGMKPLVTIVSSIPPSLPHQDMEEGSLIRVPCVPLSRVLMAANLTQVDFLTISTGTHADQKKILDVTKSSSFNVKVSASYLVSLFLNGEGQDYSMTYGHQEINLENCNVYRSRC